MARAADRALGKLAIQDQERVERRIDALAENPRPPQSTRLVGNNPRAYRLRQGDYRIVYEVDGAWR